MFETFEEKKFLLKQLVKRDLTSKYKDSALGIVWSVISPLCMMIIYTIIFSTFFRRQIQNYPVYLLSGRILYTFFVSATTACMRSIRGNKSILSKIYVPRYMFALASVAYEFINFLISFILLFLVMFFTGAQYHLTTFACIIPLILFIFLIIGFGLILAVLNSYFSDIQHIYSIIALMIMYSCALFYPMEIVPASVQVIFTLNPVYLTIACFRDTIIYGVLPDISTLLYLAVFSIMIFSIGFLLFRIQEKKLTLRL